MFGLFESPPFRDPVLGELKRSRGYWRGSLALAADQSLPLALCGSRKQPDPQAVALALAIPAAFDGWRAPMEHALFEHYGPYAESIATEEPESSTETLPTIHTSSHVWPHVTFQFISVTPLANVLTVELGLAVAWDEEHTLGARFQAGKLFELNGSVLPP